MVDGECASTQLHDTGRGEVIDSILRQSAAEALVKVDEVQGHVWRAIAEARGSQIRCVTAKLSVVFHLTGEIETVIAGLLVPSQVAEQHVSGSIGRSGSLKIRSERSVRKFSFATEQAGWNDSHRMRNHMHHDADWLPLHISECDRIAARQSGELNGFVAELSMCDLFIEDQHTGYSRR